MSSKHRLGRAFDRWLEFESAGDEARAERALGEVMQNLPGEPVPAGFADRVLAASGLRFKKARGWLPGVPSWILQGAVGLWLVASFIAVAAAAGFAVELARSGQLIDLGGRFLVGLSRLGAELLVAINALFRAGSAVSAALSGPSALGLALVCALASLSALGVLKPLLASDRSRHVAS